MEELIERLRNTGYGIGEYYANTDGQIIKNEKLTRADTDEIIKILKHYTELKEIVEEYYRTLNNYGDANSHYYLDKILDTYI